MVKRLVAELNPARFGCSEAAPPAGTRRTATSIFSWSPIRRTAKTDLTTTGPTHHSRAGRRCEVIPRADAFTIERENRTSCGTLSDRKANCQRRVPDRGTRRTGRKGPEPPTSSSVPDNFEDAAYLLMFTARTARDCCRQSKGAPGTATTSAKWHPHCAESHPFRLRTRPPTRCPLLARGPISQGFGTSATAERKQPATLPRRICRPVTRLGCMRRKCIAGLVACDISYHIAPGLASGILYTSDDLQRPHLRPRAPRR